MQDPSHCNRITLKNKGFPFHQHTPILEAIALQIMAKNITEREEIPIFEYSYINGYLQKRVYEKEQIKQLWIDACRDFMSRQIANSNPHLITHSTTEQIKILSLYGTLKICYSKSNDIYDELSPLDIHYDVDLQKEINAEIEQCKITIINDHQNKLTNKLNQYIKQDKELFSFEATQLLLNKPKLSSDQLALLEEKFLAYIDSIDIIEETNEYGFEY